MRGVFVMLAAAFVLALLYGGYSALASGGNGSYTFLEYQPHGNGSPITYSSCRRIPVEFNLSGVEDKAKTRRILLQAMGEASAASHLNVVYVGESARRPRFGSASPQGYPVLIAFAEPAELPAMEGKAGRGGSSWVDVNGLSTYVSGQIVLEKGYWNRNLDRWHGKETARAIVMHELGHVLGLGHVDDDNEVMGASGSHADEYGPGDRRGLAILGKGPCI